MFVGYLQLVLQFQQQKMIMQRIGFGSPSKENSSPTRRRRSDALAELALFLKQTGTVLPAHLSKLLTASDSPLKPTHSNSPQKTHPDLDPRKLKVQLSDTQFELKKVEEDFAQFKRTSKMEKEKEAKKQQEAMVKLRSSLQFAQEDSTFARQKLISHYEGELKTALHKAQMELEQETTKLHEQYKAKLDSLEKIQKREVAELQRSGQQKLGEKEREYRENLGRLEQQHLEEVRETGLRHKSVIEEKERRYESTYLALQSEKKTEEKLHEKSKLEHSKEKEKLLTELYYERNTNRQLSEDLQATEKEVRRLKNELKDKEVELQLKEERNCRKLQETETTYQQKYDHYELLQQQQLAALADTHRNELTILEQRLAKMEAVHKQKEELMQASLDELSGNFERRPSKREDVSEIDKLKWGLAKKEDEVRKLKQELKHTNLELENKEDIYTRIFRGNSMSRDKKTHPREDREQLLIEDKLGKEALFRKSQTADVKYLLKVYNNAKN